MLYSYLNFYKKTSWIYALAFLLCGTSLKAQVLLNEGFEGTTFVPTGWSSGHAVISGTGTPPTIVRITTPTAGAGCTGTSVGAARINDGPSGLTLDSYLATPAISVPTLATTTLTFCERERYGAAYGSIFSVRVSTSPITTSNVVGATVLYSRPENGLATFSSRTVDLTAYAGQTIYLAFVNNNTFGDAWTLDNINITAVAAAPEINLLGTDNSSIATGTTTTSTTNGTNFGTLSTTSGTTVDRTFTLQNTGTGALTVGTATSNNTNFTITQQPNPSVAVSGTTTFTVRYNPQSFGNANATITIPNNDSNENPYTFAVSGVATGPEVNIVGLGTSISNNKFLTTSTDGTFLGVVSGSTTNLSSTFTVQNIGNEPLSISGVTMRRGSASAFSIANAPTNIPVAGSADFTIAYDVAKGAQMDTVALASNDKDEAIYLFTVSAGGVVAALNNNLADGDLLISPNPSSKNFNIKIGGTKYTSVNVVVYDMAGRIVKSQNTAQFTGSMDIDLGNLEKGTYILMLETAGEKVARKLIKQ
jgi:hypothetical protein